MHPNQAGMYPNNLSAHASLLLSASPTIITSPLQNNTNNPQTTPTTSTNSTTRRQPSTQIFSNADLDTETQVTSDNPLNITLNDNFINFKKPQNEIFKKLDGKIQKIVAAHSNLNKLYALNDFSSLSAKRPFELPPQLPPPPPWVPKVSGEFGCAQWIESNSEHRPVTSTPQRPSSSSSNKNANDRWDNPFGNGEFRNTPIDSAISKLHQRRQQQQNQFPHRESLDQSKSNNASRMSLPQGSSQVKTSTPKISPAQFSILAQKIRETVEANSNKSASTSNIQNSMEKLSEEEKNNYKSDLYKLLAKEYVNASRSSDPNAPKPRVQLIPASQLDKMNDSERKKSIRDELISRIKEEIVSVTKNMKLTSPTKSPKNDVAVSLPEKFSPQSLFNTIRRETSLLLSKSEIQSRSNLSLLSHSQQTNPPNINSDRNLSNTRPSITKLQTTIKVIVPPTEYHQPKEGDTCELENSPRKAHSGTKTDDLSFHVIKRKITVFQESNGIPIGKLGSFSSSSLSSRFGINKVTKTPQKSIEKIVDRLQARQSTSPNGHPADFIDPKTSIQQQILNSSARLLQSSRSMQQISAPTPIPVFRSIFPTTGVQTGISKSANSKSKKTKRIQLLGLKIANYLEKESPQPNTEKITLEQFAKSLNLVRSNDISLQRHQEQLLQSDLKWSMPKGHHRPVRLRRFCGERMPHMPASASYKATRRVGLQ